MTRINASIPPAELCDQMLIAEHREIVRIPNTIKSGKAKVENIPDDFRLGTGHVKFFYNKLSYLQQRYLKLHHECLNRGFNVTDYSKAFCDVPYSLWNTWIPNKSTVRPLLVERINKRMSTMNGIRLYGKSISFEKAKLK